MKRTKSGMLRYDKEFHYNHRTKWTKEDREYLINFYYIAGSEEISFALGRSEISIIGEVSRLIKLGVMKEKNNYTPKLLDRKDDYITVHYNF